ncbi:hypothetical protein E3P81_03875 [Wallemia ichthyophaga]|nr:hypothetical protein E3P97_03876 [Wallemia ichthyophaga]TIB28113.1 hypothetical protein E3P85_03841 [Wallemia ichthyophaga]TIB43676.1 hypothetical protein E3P82_03881 [Wallemia ichthyophaga]TIB45905.1 hypothetical protein E3P81_03875 [Wallemia ichthyophaga]TIB48134.1 hypothetical protein E3P80_03885 [Wallemia ichthyophaga]
MSSTESNLMDLVHNQISILISTMKLNSNWSNFTPNSLPLSNLAVDLGLKGYSPVNPQPNIIQHLYSLRFTGNIQNPKEILSPFLFIITNQSTSGPITLAALQSIEKFISSDLLSIHSPHSPAAVDSIAEAISKCSFDPTDSLTDDAILNRILDIIKLILSSNLAKITSDKSASSLIETGLEMACQMRLSPSIRNSAERTIQSAVRCLLLDFKSRYQPGNSEDSSISPSKPSKSPLQDFSASQKPFGDATMSEVIRVLVNLLDPHDTKYTDTIRLAALRILDVALTTAGITLSNIPQIRSTLSDQGCKFLFQLARVESSSLLIMTIRVITVLFDTCKPHLKLQQELFFSFLVERLSPSTQDNAQSFDPFHTWEASVMPPEHPDDHDKLNTSTSGSATPSLAPAKAAKPAYGQTRQLLLETLVHFIHTPNFLSELWLNYDSDIDCDDLFERVLSFTIDGIFPYDNSSLESQLLCLEGVLTFISQVHGTLVNTPSDAHLQYPTNIALTKSRKRIILNGAQKFNSKPKLGLEYLTRHGVIDVEMADESWTKATCDSVAKFLKQCARLDKRLLGDYISRPENSEVLKSFMSLFDFRDLSIADSMRQVLETFRLPGEAQQIARITEVFAEHYFSFAPEGIRSQDSVYVLAYSVIMLNTDLHNPQNRARRMSDEAYKRNLRGVNDGADFDAAMLDDVYHSIRKREIVMPEEHHDQVGFDYAWKEMLVRSRTAGLVRDAHSPNLVKPILEASVRRVLAGLAYAFASFDDSSAIKRVMEAYAHIVYLAHRLQLHLIPDIAFVSLRRAAAVLIGRFDETENEFAQARVPLSGSKDTLTQISVSSHTVQLGSDLRAQLAAWTIFNVILRDVRNVSDSWFDLFDMFLVLFANEMLPESIQTLEDFLGGSTPIPREASGDTHAQENGQGQGKDVARTGNSTSLLSTLSSYLLAPYSSEPHMTQASDEDVDATLHALDCIRICNLEVVYSGLWHLPGSAHSRALSALTDMLDARTTAKLAGVQYNRKGIPPVFVPYDRRTVFLLELLVSISVRNRDATETTWHTVFPLLEKLLAHANVFSTLLTERAAVGLAKLTEGISAHAQLHEELFIAIDLLRSLPPHALLSATDHLVSLVESVLAKADVQNSTEWHLLIALLHCCSGRVSERVLGLLTTIIDQHLSRDSLPAVLDLLTALALHENNAALDMLLTLRREPSWDWEWEQVSALASKLGTLCLQPAKHIRQRAIEGLAAILLEKPRNDLIVFTHIAFPLLENLLRPDVFNRDPTSAGMGNTRSAVTNLVCKVWLLLDLHSLDDEHVERVWLELLDFLDRFMSSSTNSKKMNMVHESILENIKNLLLVMHANGIIDPGTKTDSHSHQLYIKTAERIDLFLQGFVGEVLKDTHQKEQTKQTEHTAETQDNDETNQAQQTHQSHDTGTDTPS